MKSHFCIKLLAVATIVVSWIPVCSPILSSLEWIAASQETLKDSMNQLVIKRIPNAACDKFSKTRGSGCHPSDATRLAQWFFSLKCIVQCNQGFGLPIYVIQDVEVNCQFSVTNTLNMTMGEIEWSAECHCPVGSIYSGSNFSTEVDSYSLMAYEYSKLKCDDSGASAETISSLTKYNEKGFAITSCRKNPSICDRHANCVDDSCICTPGYTGSGFDCFYLCKTPMIDRALKVENADGISLSEGDLIEELEKVKVTCNQIDRKQFNLTCGCDGFGDLRVCEEAIYIIGGIDKGYDYLDSIVVFYPDAAFKSYVSKIKLTTPRHSHESYLMKNGSLILINGNSDLNAIEVFNPEIRKWHAENNSSSNKLKQILNEIDDQLYICAGCDDEGNYYHDCIALDLETSVITTSYQMQQDICMSCSFMIDNSVYSVGGSSTITNVLMLNLTSSSPAWQAMNLYPSNIQDCAAATYNGFGYVCGGYVVQMTDECNEYDPTTDKWTTMASMNEKRRSFSMIQREGVLYSIFGLFSLSVEYYNITGDRKWTMMPGMDEKLGDRHWYSVAYLWN